MNLDEAIENLTSLACDLDSRVEEAKIDAIQLGIEALKLVKVNRELWGKTEAFTLPSEA